MTDSCPSLKAKIASSDIVREKSLSDNPKLLARPKDFEVTVREIKIASGAGFIIPIMGEIIRMPGLPEIPAAEAVDIDENGNIVGIF